MGRRNGGARELAWGGGAFAVLARSLALCLLVFLLFPTTTSAADFRSGNSPHVNSNETIDDDLFLFGGEADIRGRVRGDVVVSAVDFDHTGDIEGSLSVATGTATIAGTVGRSVRIAGGTVRISGEIGGDLVLLGGTITISSNASVAGDVVVTGGETQVLGPVRGAIRGNVESLTVNAPVSGDIRVSADQIRLQSRARVGGDFRYRSRNEAIIDDRADVTGEIERQEPSLFPWDNISFWFLSAVFRLLCALIAGAAIVLLAPRSAAAVADALRQTPLKSIIFGVALLILLPVALALLVATLVGLPIALVGLAFYLSALYLSQVFVGLTMGRAILPRSWGEHGRGYNLLAMTIGVIILTGLRLIPVPYLGWIIATLTAIAGLGALVLGLSRRGRPTLA